MGIDLKYDIEITERLGATSEQVKLDAYQVLFFWNEIFYYNKLYL